MVRRMDIATGVGASERVAIYTVPDHQMAKGSTLGGPKVCAVIKATGALEKVYSVDLGAALFGTLVLHHWDERTGLHLSPRQGSFTLHPEHQEHDFYLANGLAVHEDIFVLSGPPGADGAVDPPAVYYTVDLRNDSSEELSISTYAFCQLRGDTEHDVAAAYDKRLGAIVAWNEGQPEQARVFGCSEKPAGFETTDDYAKAVAGHSPGALSGRTDASPGDPLGVLHHVHTLGPGEGVSFYYLLSFSGDGRKGAEEAYRSCPNADEALARTMGYYHDMLDRCMVLTPNPDINRGVLWAKANMLRIMLKAPTGWCFTNDPARSNNAVGRDTAWFAFGGDYFAPSFVRESLRAFVRLQEPDGMIVEYYDIRNGKTDDYGLNINDNTPLLILALWHHYSCTGDEDFLREVYPAALKAARYILSQRNEQGLVWCTATGTSDWGIIGWRNVIKNYRLSGATTEVNSECYAALRTMAGMARVMGDHEVSAEFSDHADALRQAINTHLYDSRSGLYYLNIDVDGTPRSDVTSDLVFPVMFGVADDDRAARIVSRLSSDDFWTAAGMRVLPRDAPHYDPGREPAYGLMGGVWVGVTFWYAFAAARVTAEFADEVLGASFRNYSRDPLKNNTVPGQFSEWLNGETLVNEGMMLSPWFPPRYLWAAIEGMGGVDHSDGAVQVHPRLAPDWSWMGLRNLPYRGKGLTWFAVRVPDVVIYSNSPFQEATPYLAYEEDISDAVHVGGESTCALGLRQGPNLIVFVGNTDAHTIATAVRVEATTLAGAYRCRTFNSLRGQWVEEPDLISAERLRRGITVQIERKGFCLYDLKQEV